MALLADRLRRWFASRHRGKSGALVLFAVVFFTAAHAAGTDRIFVAARVNGIPMRFALDTGAGVETSMWREVGDMLALKATWPDASAKIGPGEVRAGITEPLTISVLGRTFADSRIAIVDAPDFAKWQIQGILGWPGVRNNIWVIDLARGQVGMVPELPDVSGWLKYPIVAAANTLVFQVDRGAGREPGLISIDTGSADGVALPPAAWAEWRAAHPDAPLTYEGDFMLATGYGILEVSAAKEWVFDKLVLKDVQVEQANGTDLALHGPNYVATFGLGALRKLSAVIDGKNGFAYFRPVDAAGSIGSYNRLGAQFIPTDKAANTWKAAVLPRTPGALAGIRDGDVLVGLNHLEIGHWRKRPGAWPPHDAFSQPAGMPLELELDRAGKHVTAHAVLQNILDPAAAPVAALPAAVDAPAFHFLPPLASVIRKADALKLPLREARLSPDGAVRKDDKVTALVTVADDDRLQQWLVYVVSTELKPAERKPGSPHHIYSSSGRDLVFQRMPTGIAVRSIGPFERAGDEKGVSDEWSGAILDQQSLTVGFDSVAATLRKLSAARGARFGFRSTPFPADQTVAERKIVEAAGIGVEDERAFVAGAGGLTEFFRIAGQTPGVRDVLRRLLDLSWKDYLRSPNININFRGPVEEGALDWWGLPPGMPCRILTFDISLNGTPKIVCQVAATRPMRPLETIAGIVGIAAGRTDGSGPHVMVRLLGATPGP